MKSAEEREEEISHAAELADAYLRMCNDTLVMSSRELITGKSEFLKLHFINNSQLEVCLKPSQIIGVNCNCLLFMKIQLLMKVWI